VSCPPARAYGGAGGTGYSGEAIPSGGPAWTSGDDYTYPDEFGSDAGGAPGGGSGAGGGGSGGSIWLDCGSLSGNGVLSANGGDGVLPPSLAAVAAAAGLRFTLLRGRWRH